MNNFIKIEKKYGQSCLEFNFPQLKDSCSISFQRTLRIPDDNKNYPLPPSLGEFQLSHVEDYKENLPPVWSEHGGVFFPMYQAEAMWMNFGCGERPFAMKIATGKINAVSGEAWTPELKNNGDEPDYITIPTQPWLDGFNVGKGVIRQFVAMPLGSGYTVEEQITSKAEFGGIQIIVYPMKEEVWQKIKPKMLSSRSAGGTMVAAACSVSLEAASIDMGLGAGGFMQQDIYDDDYGIDAWDQENGLKVFVHLANSLQYKNITGQEPPQQVPGPDVYKNYHYPWFEYYSDKQAIEGSKILAKVDSIASQEIKNNDNVLPDEGHKPSNNVNIIGQKVIKGGKW